MTVKTTVRIEKTTTKELHYDEAGAMVIIKEWVRSKYPQHFPDDRIDINFDCNGYGDFEGVTIRRTTQEETIE